MTRKRVSKEEKQQRHEWAMKQIDRGVGFSELASLISETLGCTRRNARHVVSLAHKERMEIAFGAEEIDQRDLLFQCVARPGLGHPELFLFTYSKLVDEAMSIINRIKSPGEIYVLLVTFVFTEQFDRNLDLEAVEEGAIRNFLEISHSFLDALANHTQPIGAAFFVYASILIALRLSGNKSRRLIDVLAIFLTACLIVELVIINLLLVAPIKSPALLIVELLLFIPIILVCFSWWYWRINYGRFERNL